MHIMTTGCGIENGCQLKQRQRRTSRWQTHQKRQAPLCPIWPALPSCPAQEEPHLRSEYPFEGLEPYASGKGEGCIVKEDRRTVS